MDDFIATNSGEAKILSDLIFQTIEDALEFEDHKENPKLKDEFMGKCHELKDKTFKTFNDMMTGIKAKNEHPRAVTGPQTTGKTVEETHGLLNEAG